MKKIAFLASPNYHTILSDSPAFVDELKLLQPVFLERNAELISADWRDSKIDWQAFDVIIPKACWDYSEHSVEFEQYLRARIAQKAKFKNDAETVLWNMRKTYLRDLESKNLSVAEFSLVSQGKALDLPSLSKNFAPDAMVVAKPSISGGARNTIRCQASQLSLHQDLLETILKEADLIIQPYFEEIAVHGEYSFLFFNGVFSHAVLKTPASGDFRVQPYYGATTTAYVPSEAEIVEAGRFVNANQTRLAYARVDGFKRKHKFQLVELELIEPYLFFENAPATAVHAFVNSILS